MPDVILIVDCGRMDSGSPAMPIVRSADAMILLTNAHADDLAHLPRRLPTIGRWSPHPVMLLVGEGYSSAEVARELGVPPLGRVPDDPRGAAVLRGRPTRCGGVAADQRIRRSGSSRKGRDRRWWPTRPPHEPPRPAPIPNSPTPVLRAVPGVPSTRCRPTACGPRQLLAAPPNGHRTNPGQEPRHDLPTQRLPAAGPAAPPPAPSPARRLATEPASPASTHRATPARPRRKAGRRNRSTCRRPSGATPAPATPWAPSYRNGSRPTTTLQRHRQPEAGRRSRRRSWTTRSQCTPNVNSTPTARWSAARSSSE